MDAKKENQDPEIVTVSLKMEAELKKQARKTAAGQDSDFSKFTRQAIREKIARTSARLLTITP